MKNEKKILFFNIINNIHEIRRQYNLLLSPFFDKRQIKQWRSHIYSLPLDENQKNFIWEFINGDIEEEKLQQLKQKFDKKST